MDATSDKSVSDSSSEPQQQQTAPQPMDVVTPSADDASAEASAPNGVAEEEEVKEEASSSLPPPPEPLLLGLDFGTNKCVAALTRNQDMFPVIVQNNLANQVTPNVVSFRDKRRFIGEEALNSLVRAPQQTLHSMKRFLGKSKEEATAELEMLPFRIASSDDSSSLAFEVSFRGEQQTLRPEEVTAMMLKQLRSFTNRNAETLTGEKKEEVKEGEEEKSKINGCVVAVPNEFDAKARRALLDACAIAQIPVLKVINESTAVALCYGFSRVELRPVTKDSTTAPTEQQKPAEEGEATDTTKVLFVDMGHSYLNVQLVEFTPRKKMNVLASISDERAGAREIDFCLVRHFAEELKQKRGVDVFRSARYLSKLLHAAERTKKVLSTIDEAMFEAENIEDADFRAKISRAKMEELCKEVTDRITAAIQRTLSEAKLESVEQLHSVEIVGGGTCIPAVQASIKAALPHLQESNKDVSRTLNSAGSVAIGSALMAAILSPEVNLHYEVEEAGQQQQELEKEISGLAEEQIAASIQKEEEMRRQDELVIATEHKINELESLIYRMKGYCSDPSFDPYLTSEEKGSLTNKLDEFRDWVEDNKEDGDFDLFTNKLAELQSLIHSDSYPKLHQRLNELEEERKKAEAEQAAAQQLLQQQQGDKEKQPRTNKQKLEAAAKKKNHGNIVFKEFDYESAARCYGEGIRYLLEMYDATPKQKEEMEALKLSCYSNLAICCIKLKRFEEAVHNCTKALELNEKNAKALFRRGQSFAELKQWDKAKEDLQAASALEPNDAAIKKELARVNKAIQIQVQQQKKVYAKMFG
ncbi:adenyl-nucleotide exchange factor sse1 [Balamuthia mandrillaris]